MEYKIICSEVTILNNLTIRKMRNFSRKSKQCKNSNINDNLYSCRVDFQIGGLPINLHRTHMSVGHRTSRIFYDGDIGYDFLYGFLQMVYQIYI